MENKQLENEMENTNPIENTENNNNATLLQIEEQEKIEEVLTTDPINIEHKRILNALLFLLKPIDYRAKANLQDGQELAAKHYIILTIQEILEKAKERKWSLCLNDGHLYLYNGEAWSEINKDALKNFLGEAAEKLGVDLYTARYYNFRDTLFKQFMTTAYLPKPVRQSNEVLINLKNGTFKITPEKQSIREFDRNDFLTYQLPFAWEDGKEAPIFQAYLDKVLPDITQQLVLAEFIGYTFISQRTLKLEKALILYGTGANGKSVFFEIITALLGPSNVSNYSLQSLTNENGYTRAMLINKLLNYASEISPNMDSTVFKQLVSGEPVEARLPYKEPIILEDYAKLVFNTNELPRDTEQNEAFFRRFLIIQFGLTIPESERDPTLAPRIIASELPGVFNWILAGLRRLLLQKKLTYSMSIENAGKLYRQQSDSVQIFLADDGYQKEPNASYRLKQLYEEYKIYCMDFGYKACSQKTLSERLKNLDYDITRKSFGNAVGIIKTITTAA